MCVHMIILPFCEEAFEDNVDENTVNTEDASNSGNEKIEIEIRGDVKKTVHTDFCEEAFKGNADEDIVNGTAYLTGPFSVKTTFGHSVIKFSL